MTDVLPGVQERTTALPRAAVERARAKLPTIGEFDWSGSRKEIEFPKELRASIADRLQARSIAANDLKNNDETLNVYERLLTGDRGQSLVDKMTDPNQALSAEDMALAWTIIVDEGSQKKEAVGKAVSEQKINQFGTRVLAAIDHYAPNAGLFGRVARGLRSVVASSQRGLGGQSEVRTTSTTEPILTSAYIDHIGFTRREPDWIVNDLLNLTRTQEAIEKMLGFPAPTNLEDKIGNRLHDTAVDRADAILQREYGGATLAELRARGDGVEAARVESKALQESLRQFSDKMAKDLLKAEKPDISLDAIDAAIASVGTPLTGKRKEQAGLDVKDAEEVLREVRAEAQRMRSTGHRQNLDQGVAEAQEASQTAQDTRAAQMPTVNAELTALRASLAAQRVALAGALVGSPAAARIQQELDRLRTEVQSKVAERRTLQDTVAQTSAALVRANAALTLLDVPDPGGGLLAPRGSIVRANQEIGIVLAEVQRLENIREGRANPDEEQVRDALKTLRKVAEPENYERIIDRRFKRGDQERFRRERLADTTVVPGTGQMVGAELLREHILAVADSDSGYRTPQQQERGRRMYSDETFARGIIKVFNIDITEGTPPHEVFLVNIDNAKIALATAEDNLRAARAAGAPPATIAAREAAVRTQRDTLTRREHRLLRRLLPQLENATNAQVGELLRFVVHESLNNATVGRPFAGVGNEHLTQTPERRITVDSIVRQDMGSTQITDVQRRLASGGMDTARLVTWRGELPFSDPGLLGLPPVPGVLDGVNFQVQQVYNSDGINITVAVEANEGFLQRLPNIAPVGMLPTVRAAFYNINGSKRTREQLRAVGIFIPEPMARVIPGLQRNAPQWVQVGASNGPTNVTPDVVLANLEVTVGAQIDQRLSTATASEVIVKTNAQRQELVRNFEPVRIQTNNGNIAQLINYDNGGRFWIEKFIQPLDALGAPAIDPATGFLSPRVSQGRLQLDSYLEQLRNEYLQFPNRQQAIQAEMVALESEMGREILRTQARRFGTV